MRTLFLSTLIFVAFSFISLAQSWFPLEVGNEAQFKAETSVRISIMGSSVHTFSFFSLKILDSTYINGKKYFCSNGFFDFPNGTLLRYDQDSCKLFIYQNGNEYLYMDFLLPDGSTISQIQPNNTFLLITIGTSSAVILGDTLTLKVFSRESSNGNKQGWYYFAPEIGIVKQIEHSSWVMVAVTSFDLIEYRYSNSQGDIIHKKHGHSASIQFNPITSLNFGEKLQQEFVTTHPLSVKSYPAALQGGRTYLSDVFLDLYYSNGVDSGYNEQYPIDSLSEIDFSLNYSVDTLKYINGYSLYYRIVAKDKGIVPSYYYKPINGYYKLVYSPSQHQVLFSDDSLYIQTLADSGSTKIINTSEIPVRIDSIISVGSFYGYHGNFSRPGFEYPFYFVQTSPGFTGDTLGIVIPPHDSINVSFSNVDLCPICDYEVQEYFKDTLRFVFTFMDENVYSFSKSIPISGEGYPSDVEEDDVLPSEFALHQNYPNPFNPSTKISWQSPIGSWQSLKIFDVLGNEVVTLVNEYREAGKYELEFNAEKLSSGVYYYQLRAGSLVQTKKMIYLK